MPIDPNHPADPNLVVPPGQINETVLTFNEGGQDFDIDHLGIGYPDSQWGNFAVYRGAEMVAEFCLPEHGLNPEYQDRSRFSVTDDELAELAREAVADMERE